MTMASMMGRRKERRVNMVVEGWAGVCRMPRLCQPKCLRFALPLEHSRPAGWVPLALPVTASPQHWQSQWHTIKTTCQFPLGGPLRSRPLGA